MACDVLWAVGIEVREGSLIAIQRLVRVNLHGLTIDWKYMFTMYRICKDYGDAPTALICGGCSHRQFQSGRGRMPRCGGLLFYRLLEQAIATAPLTYLD